MQNASEGLPNYIQFSVKTYNRKRIKNLNGAKNIVGTFQLI